jgi:hypothetical protein
MKFFKTKLTIELVLLLVFIFLSSCDGFRPDGHEENTSQPSATSSLAPTNSPIATPSLTPLPTVSVGEAEEFLRELFQSNKGCRLPCWWGIIPGESRWSASEDFLRSIGMDLKQGQDIDGATNYTFYHELSGDVVKDQVVIGVKDDLVLGFTVYPGGTEINYQLHQLLSEYGKPDNILVGFTVGSPTGELLFHLQAFYLDLGIFAFYDFPAEIVGNDVRSCLEPIGPRLILWSPEQSPLEYEDIVPPHPQLPPPSIDYIPGLDLFYETFKDPNHSTCIVSPLDLW